jgi:hypothetical protein
MGCGQSEEAVPGRRNGQFRRTNAGHAKVTNDGLELPGGEVSPIRGQGQALNVLLREVTPANIVFCRGG